MQQFNTSKKISNLLNSLNYEFKNYEYLSVALTHSSYINEHESAKKLKSNERLEFLGDAVLELIIVDYLFNSLKFKEGILSKYRSEIVSENSLAMIAKKLNLGHIIKFGKGEIKNKGYNNKSILADAMEALIGAIYLDSNFETTKKLIIKLFKEIIIKTIENKNFNDYKTQLQEIVQKNNKSNIMYRLEDEKGSDNNKLFYISVIINGNILGNGYGKTKKSAEQEAAKKALKILGEENA